MTIKSSPSTLAERHIGVGRQTDIDTMLQAAGYDGVDGLVDSAVPDSIRQQKPLRRALRRSPANSRLGPADRHPGAGHHPLYPGTADLRIPLPE